MLLHRHNLLLLIITLLLSTSWTPVTVSAQPQTLPAAIEGELDLCGNGTGTASITGKVTRAKGGSPVEGTSVVAATIYGTTIETTATDIDGTYTLTGLPGGIYIVSALAEGALMDEVYNNQSSANTFTAVQVADGQSKANINFSLEAGTVFEGTVTDATTGDPLRNVLILVHDAANEDDVIATRATNLEGFYQMHGGLPPGSYKVSFSSTLGERYRSEYYDNQSTFAAATLIEVSDQATITLDAELTSLLVEEATVSGKVTAADTDAPLQGVFVSAVNLSSGDNAGGDVTGPDGLYTFTVPYGAYHIYGRPFGGTDVEEYVGRYFGGNGSHSAAETVEVSAGNDAGGIDMELARGAMITGRVMGNPGGVGLAYATVNAYRGDDSNFQDQNVFTTADASGYYTLPAVATGAYTISVASTYRDCLFVPELAENRVTVNGPSNVPNINFTLQGGGLIRGRGTDAESGGGVGGFIIIEDEEGETVYSGFRAATGYYKTGALAPGSYYVRFAHSQSANPYFGNVYYPGDEDRDDAQLVQVQAAKSTDGIDITLSPQEVSDLLLLPSLKKQREAQPQ